MGRTFRFASGALALIALVALMALPANAQYEPAPPPSDPPGTTTDGCGVTITGAAGTPVSATIPGFSAGTPYQLTFTYPPNVWVNVGANVADSDPHVTHFTIPPTAPAGTAALTAKATDGSGVEVTCPVVVLGVPTASGTGELPRTGFGSERALKFAGLAIAAGGLLVIATRPRHGR